MADLAGAAGTRPQRPAQPTGGRFGPQHRRALPHEAEASPADNASQRTLNALVHETAAHTSKQLSMVRQALSKFDDQSYGLCENCGGEIGFSRLDARPEARLCIGCQTRMEQRRR
jgi:DnaK suppressor protein